MHGDPELEYYYCQLQIIYSLIFLFKLKLCFVSAYLDKNFSA
jgi:hypothetical protein